MDSTVTIAIFAFITFSIPVIGALWRIFAVREMLQLAITNNSHRLDLIEQKIEYLVDQQVLALNGLKEATQHVRDRSARSEEKLADRLLAVERYLNKTTDFTVRHRD
jgi:hypothetical protein